MTVLKFAYPEHEKLKAIADKSQVCGEFLEWLTGAQKYTLGEYHEHVDECYETGNKICDVSTKKLYPAGYSLKRLLAKYFDIDEQKLEAEKLAMLEEQRAFNSA